MVLVERFMGKRVDPQTGGEIIFIKFAMMCIASCLFERIMEVNLPKCTMVMLDPVSYASTFLCFC